MSTKRLARTIVEGGRVGSNKFEKQAETRAERAAERDFLKKCVLDPEHSEEDVIQERRTIRKEFNDRFGAFKRYIDSNVGKSWNRVYSELKEKFPEDIVKNWHMILHVKQMIDINQEFVDVRLYHPTYYVDDNGIIRKTKKQKRKYTHLSKEQEIELLKWLDRRFIKMIDGVLYWYVRENKESITVQVDWGKVVYSFLGMTDYMREDGKLLPEEVNYFRALPEYIKDSLLNYKKHTLSKFIF